MSWKRVSPKHPCPVCQKKDYCCITDDGSLTLCMRVESSRPSRGKAGGWLHKTGEPSGHKRLDRQSEPKHISEQSAAKLLRTWKRDTNRRNVEQLAVDLGVKAWSLESLGVVWCDGRSCWAFPMKDIRGKPIGIRFRTSQRKVSVGGSKSGLFFSDGLCARETVWLTEGPTDTAALMSIGAKCVVGRSSLTSCWDDVRAILAKFKAKRAILVTDDETTEEKLEAKERGEIVGPVSPGRVESRRLAKTLSLPCKFVLVPGCKDIREYVKSGGTMKGIIAMLEHQKWVTIK